MFGIFSLIRIVCHREILSYLRPHFLAQDLTSLNEVTIELSKLDVSQNSFAHVS